MLALGGIAGAAAIGFHAWPAVQRLIPHRFVFQDLNWPPGFRRISLGQVSGGPSPLAGIEAGVSQTAKKAADWVETHPCRALFGSEAIPAGIVPIASFSDYNCPYCKVLLDILVALEEDSRDSIRVVWHEWPTLGPSSEIMASAALAARRQGSYRRFHHTLMQTRFVPDTSYLTNLAERQGIDPQLLLADMKSPEVAWDVARSTALAKAFGFRGTPGLVVGRTAVSGAIGDAELRDLIEIERKAGPIPGCTTA